jgi:hypothetical protein
MTTAPRTFKAMPKSMDMNRLKSAVNEVAREDNVPTLSFPDSPSTISTEPAATPPADTSVTVTALPKPKSPRKSNPAPVKRVAVDLPDYLIKKINTQAAEEGVTKRYLYLKAFRADGFTVHDIDMMEDGRRES